MLPFSCGDPFWKLLPFPIRLEVRVFIVRPRDDCRALRFEKCPLTGSAKLVKRRLAL